MFSNSFEIYLKMIDCILVGVLFYLSSVTGLNVIHFVQGVGHSHLMFDYRLANESVSQGHNVTVWTSLTMEIHHSAKLHPNITEYIINMSESKALQGFEEFMDLTWQPSTFRTIHKVMKAFYKHYAETCKYQVENSMDIIRKLREQKFDIAIGPGLDVCPVIVSNLIGIPPDKVILDDSLVFLQDSIARYMGIPINPSYIPHCVSPYSDNMAFFERAVNTLMVVYFYFPKNTQGVGDEIELFEGLSTKNPSLTEIISSVTTFMINGELMMEYPRPFPQGIGYLPEIGHEYDKKPTKLEPVFENILQKNNKGVIIVSFGSITDTHTMPSAIKFGMLQALSQFSDYSVIWKFDLKDMPEIANYSHIHTFSWIPQRDLIQNDRTKVLVSHCGFNSLLEAAKTGIPVVCCPLFGDQLSNSARAIHHGLGVAVDIKATDFSSEIFASKIITVLHYKNYETRAKRFAAILGTKILTAEEELSNRIKQVAKFGRKLRTLQAAVKLNLLQYLCLDILSCYFVFLFLLYTVTN